MSSLLLDYIILSCLFNIPYFWFNWEDHIFEHIKKTYETTILDLQHRDPFNPRLKELLSIDLDEMRDNGDKLPILKLIWCLVFFPINLTFLIFIILDLLRKK